MKSKKIVAMTLAGLLMFCGCGSDSKDNNNNSSDNTKKTESTQNTKKDIDVNAVVDSLKNNIEFSAELAQDSKEVVDSYFGITEDMKVDAVMYSISATCEQVAVFKAQDEDSAKTISENVDSYLEAQKGTFAQYDPSVVTRIDNAINEVKGNCVVLVVCDDADSAKEKVEEAFN